MTPIPHPCVNSTFTAPGCDPLPILRSDDILISFWQPTAEQRALIAAGHCITLSVFGGAQPPVHLSTEPVPEDGEAAPTLAFRLRETTSACASIIEHSGLAGHEAPVALGFLVADLAAHTRTDLRVMLHMVREAAQVRGRSHPEPVTVLPAN